MLIKKINLNLKGYNYDKETMKWYHGTSEDMWQTIQQEGMLFGRRYFEGREVSRCTYLATDIEEAKQYGNIILEVKYNPFNEQGNIKEDERGIPLNNYVEGCWQLRVYEPIPIENVKRIC